MYSFKLEKLNIYTDRKISLHKKIELLFFNNKNQFILNL